MGLFHSSNEHGLVPGALRPGESPLKSWAAHVHWVVLTNSRILGLSGAEILPEHRRVEWEVELGSVREVQVPEIRPPEPVRMAPRPEPPRVSEPRHEEERFEHRAPPPAQGQTAALFAVRVDGRDVYEGGLVEAREIASAIESAMGPLHH